MLARVKLNLSPVVYEDGNATRDFVDARDIARANVFIAQTKNTNQKIFNVGTGKNTSFYTMAKKLIKYSNRKLDIKIVNSARQSDIRHCFADNSKISSLGFDFKFDIDKGIKHLITWGKNRRAIDVFTENNKETKEICI
jgi:dTDP-L-rhamnose 4-epimerase